MYFILAFFSKMIQNVQPNTFSTYLLEMQLAGWKNTIWLLARFYYHIRNCVIYKLIDPWWQSIFKLQNVKFFTYHIFCKDFVCIFKVDFRIFEFVCFHTFAYHYKILLVWVNSRIEKYIFVPGTEPDRSLGEKQKTWSENSSFNTTVSKFSHPAVN